MDEKMLIRPVQLADGVMLRENCFPDLGLADVYRRLDTVLEERRNKRMWGVVAQVETRVVGYGQLGLWGSRCEISDMIVHEEWRSQGIGSEIILYLLNLAREKRFYDVEIGVAESNDRALALYQRLGFEEKKRLTLNLGKGYEEVIYLSMNLLETEPT